MSALLWLVDNHPSYAKYKDKLNFDVCDNYEGPTTTSSTPTASAPECLESSHARGRHSIFNLRGLAET
eukprot:CAMPEP_0173454000 /NCGR_PEP_ID=MMETSP1357-20121228/51612_1 /TAXON_ID=77926 /ORGANISM="Hemiselmis rufescens, Strain PCC563" /LENGTH=67 /DNA_ID=CAMNT_0014421007 /DNA_START=12 /DNA_END=212 /DNA_ORIENTATION=-